MKVYLTNFGYFISGEFANLAAARAAGDKTGFEYSVHKDGAIIGYKTTFGGWRNV